MKVKEMIKKLKSLDPEAVVVGQDYTGCHHTILNVRDLIDHPKGSTITNWDNSTNTSSVNHTGQCKTRVVYLQLE